MPNKTLIDNDILINEYYLNAINVNDLCKKYKISTNTLFKILKQYYCPRRNKILRSHFSLDLTNQKFGKLLAIEKIEKKHNSRYVLWKFKCDCGNIVEKPGPRVKEGHIKSCGCLHKEVAKSYKMDKNPNWLGYKGIRGGLWSSIKRGALVRKLEFNITIEDIWELWINQDGKCALTKLPLELEYRDSNKKNRTASLDRIDSSKGYIKGNIQWVHKDINYMKMNISEDKFKYYCKLVVQNVDM